MKVINYPILQMQTNDHYKFNYFLELPNLHHRLEGMFFVRLGIDLGDGRAAVAEDYAGGFEAEFLSQFGRGVVSQLVRMPAVGLPPRLQFGLLLLRQALLPLCLRFAFAPGQRLRRRECLLAGALDCTAVGVRGVSLAG